MQNSAQSFVIPGNLSLEDQVAYCKKIIFKYRSEAMLLRRDKQKCEYDHTGLKEKLKKWEQQYEILRESLKRSDKENSNLKKDNGKLKKEIEKLTASNAAYAKINERYRVSLFDHGNFKHPNNQEKKPKGGQKRHANTNKDKQRDYASFKKERVYSQACGKCGNPLNRTTSTKDKTLIDIEINPQLLQLIIQSERQWCSTCKKKVRATHPQSLPFTEYGINAFMVVLYLRFKGKQSFGTISCILNNLFELPITKSGIGTILRQAKEYLQDKYEELKQAIRNGEIMYNDETGWSVRGKSAWMWIMTTSDEQQTDRSIKTGMTVYIAAESR